MEFKYKRFKEEFNYLEALFPKEEWDFREFEIDGKTSEGMDTLFEKYPQLTKDGEYLRLFIELETGRVINWPIELGAFDFYDAKIVDNGIYTLIGCNEHTESDLSYEGYVPTCLGDGGYGDYLEFEIDDKGYIKPWKFTNKDYIEFLREEPDWDD